VSLDRYRANMLAVIDFVLSHTLRLFHPFLPFISEELWQGMGYSADMPENQGGKTIMFATWPKAFEEDFLGHYGLDNCYLEIAETKYDLVTRGRNLRREGNIPANKKVRFIFRPANDLPPYELEVIKLLLNAEVLEVNPNYQAPKGTPNVHSTLGDLFMPLEAVQDVAGEKARLNKEIEKSRAEIVRVQERLNNPAFTQKAPVNVLAEHQKRLAEWEEKLQRNLTALQALEG
jgi:valyl-tRNA synthetase